MMIGRSLVTSPRVCREAEFGKTVLHCSFHPFDQVLACAISGGRISLLEKPSEYSCDAVKSVPFTFWKETVSETGPHYPVKCLQWSVDGTRFAAGFENGAVAVWDQTGRILIHRRKHTGSIRCLRWSTPDFHIFATASNDGTVVIWDATKRRSPQVQRIICHDGHPVHDISWIGENQLATVTPYDNDGFIHVWNLGQETPVAILAHGDAVCSIRWNDHVKLLASASNACRESVQIWSPNQPECPIKRFRTTHSPVLTFDWLPSRADALTDQTLTIVCGCEDGTLVIWNLNCDADDGLGNVEAIQGHIAPVRLVSFSPDARCLASIDQLGCLVIRLAWSWKPIYEARFAIAHETNRLGFSWNGSGDSLVISNQSAEVWLVEIGDLARA